MVDAFLQGTLGHTGLRVHRLGLAASYRPGERAVERALDEGMNYLFCFGVDGQMLRVLRRLPPGRREQVVIGTGAYNWIWWRQDLLTTLEQSLRQLRTDYIDVFHFLGVMQPKEMTPRVLDQLAQLRAETEVFPHLAAHGVGLVSYTATRWTYLLRRSRHWPQDRPIPTAGQAYRFVLTNPHVDVCLTAPKSEKELLENLAAARSGPLPEAEMALMREYGDVVHAHAGWFM